MKKNYIIPEISVEIFADEPFMVVSKPQVQTYIDIQIDAPKVIETPTTVEIDGFAGAKGNGHSDFFKFDNEKDVYEEEF